jgi:hypothetical protein
MILLASNAKVGSKVATKLPSDMPKNYSMYLRKCENDTESWLSIVEHLIVWMPFVIIFSIPVEKRILTIVCFLFRLVALRISVGKTFS